MAINERDKLEGFHSTPLLPIIVHDYSKVRFEFATTLDSLKY
jgi:hypothetical protein